MAVKEVLKGNVNSNSLNKLIILFLVICIIVVLVVIAVLFVFYYNQSKDILGQEGIEKISIDKKNELVQLSLDKYQLENVKSLKFIFKDKQGNSYEVVREEVSESYDIFRDEIGIDVNEIDNVELVLEYDEESLGQELVDSSESIVDDFDSLSSRGSSGSSSSGVVGSSGESSGGGGGGGSSGGSSSSGGGGGGGSSGGSSGGFGGGSGGGTDGGAGDSGGGGGGGIIETHIDCKSLESLQVDEIVEFCNILTYTKLGEVEFCEKLESDYKFPLEGIMTDAKDYCWYKLAYFSGNKDYCEKIANVNSKNLCL